jgi:hypothetical protein
MLPLLLGGYFPDAVSHDVALVPVAEQDCGAWNCPRLEQPSSNETLAAQGRLDGAKLRHAAVMDLACHINRPPRNAGASR